MLACTIDQSTDTECLITGVRVLDADRYGKGGLVKIVDGGLHRNNVTINFCSKPGEAMLYNIILNGICAKNQPNESHIQAIHTNPTPSYGWNVQPANVSSTMSTFNSSSVLVQNITSPSNKPWWHFW